MLEILLLNFLFLLIPFLIYITFFDTKTPRNFGLVLTFLAIITMILCMSYPIHLKSGFIFDLRYIPVIIIGLYLGYQNIVILYVALNIYRFFIGGDGFVQSFLFSTFISIVMSLCHRKFISLNGRYRIYFAVFASFLTMVFYIFTLSFQVILNREFWMLTLNSVTTYVVMTMIIMSLIERVLSNIKARDLIIQSERFQVISELSASVAHEIRNPLTTTHGFLQLLSQSQDMQIKEKDYVKYSLQELQRAEKIVSDFLAFSKPQDEDMVDSDFKEEMEYAKNILMPYANMHNVLIQVNFHNSLHKRVNKSLIKQCFINLYKNGIEAMKDEGGILSIDVSEQKKNIIIKIQDSGIGMTNEEIISLGKPYYSTKKHGTGLGMVMVYNAIHKVGGNIKVESQKGKGTTFTLIIPV